MPKKNYYFSTLSFNQNNIPQGRLLGAANSLTEALRDVKNLLNVYTKDGVIKKIEADSGFELFSASKDGLDKILPDIKAVLSTIESDRELAGLFTLYPTEAKEYNTFSGEWFGNSAKLKEITNMVKKMGGSISEEGRTRKVELPKGVTTPTGVDGIKSVRSSFTNARTNLKKFLSGKAVNWPEYLAGNDIIRKSLMHQAMQIERNEIAARPDVATRLYRSKEDVARVNADVTSQRIDEIIARGEEPILPATTAARLKPSDKARWASYKRYWEESTIIPAMEKRDLFGRISRQDRQAEYIKEYIKKNPQSSLAKRKKEADEQRMSSMVGYAAKAVIVNILAALGLAVSMLTKVYAYIGEIKELVRKQVLSSAHYNIVPGEIENYRRFTVAHKLDDAIFNRIFGKVVERFSLPDQLDTGAIGLLAPLMQGGTGALVGFLTRNANSPDVINSKIMQIAMDAVLNMTDGIFDYDSHARTFESVNARLQKI